ncbi:glutaredoxin isoform X1 [Diaphorina citri]|uniref:Glutaredoxin-2, mitochondrial n=2 Tax=Diaphorina citri TaxID=121845 RepID=A0A1S4E6Y6_DIACI|nr:glutaredoxin isoform X1 [Diaphorina citri]
MCKLVVFFLIDVILISCASSKVMNPASKQFVQDLIASEKIVIFSKSYCPYCKMAKDVFQKLKVTPKTVELDHRDDGDSIQDVLLEITGARSVPRVFVNGKFIGGGTDVKALYEKGELHPLVQ